MNYSQTAKNEVIKLGFSTDCCKVAFLSAVIHSTGSVVIRDKTLAVEILSENALLLEKTAKIINELYGVQVESSGLRKIVLSGSAVGAIMCDIGIFRVDGEHTVVESGIAPSVVENRCCAVNYIRGVFLGAGSMSAKKGYHLEFGVSNEQFAADFAALLESFGIQGKTIKRETKIIVYLKGSEAVCDCLALMGASKAVLQLNDQLAYRDVRRNYNRLSNCEYANIGKTVDASVKQVEAIKCLKKHNRYDSLPEKIMLVAKARTDNPEMSLSELALVTGIARSTIKNRLNKLVEYAEEIKEEKNA